MGYNALEQFLKNNNIEYSVNEPMCRHTSFKIGGTADIFINICGSEALKKTLTEIKSMDIPFFILGNGSNILVSDKGIEGAVLSLLGLNSVTVEDNLIYADAGASLTAVCNKALDMGLEGLEFAFGIPGSVGGALFMNAGAYGGEMSQVVLSAEYLNDKGEIADISADQMELGYRKSIFKRNNGVITRVCFKLKRGDKAEIKAKMDDFMSRRRDKQPLEYPSAGSTFKRPEGYFAGALIEKNNLKGMSVGGAMVSEKHAGFVINCGNACCSDILCLMKRVQKAVWEADGVELEPEIIFVGRE